MKKPHIGPKSARVNGKLIRNPPPPRKRPPKDNLGDVPAMFGAMGPGFRIPGRPVPRVRPPAGHSQKNAAALPPAPPKYMLDTNTCIYLMVDGWARVEEQFVLCQKGEVVMSAVSLAELRQGVALAKDNETRKARISALRRILRLVPVLPFDAAAADCCEQLGVYARARERENDKLIAAHAFQRKLTLVTNDLRHFNRYPGLRLENWT